MVDSKTNEVIDRFIDECAKDIPEGIKQAFVKESGELRAKISKFVELVLSHPSDTKPDIQGFVKSKVDGWVSEKYLKIHYIRYCKFMHSVGERPVSINRFGTGTRFVTPVLKRFLLCEKNNLSIGVIVNKNDKFEAEIIRITSDGYLILKRDGKTVRGSFNPAAIKLVK